MPPRSARSRSSASARATKAAASGIADSPRKRRCRHLISGRRRCRRRAAGTARPRQPARFRYARRGICVERTGHDWHAGRKKFCEKIPDGTRSCDRATRPTLLEFDDSQLPKKCKLLLDTACPAFWWLEDDPSAARLRDARDHAPTGRTTVFVMMRAVPVSRVRRSSARKGGYRGQRHRRLWLEAVGARRFRGAAGRVRIAGICEALESLAARSRGTTTPSDHVILAAGETSTTRGRAWRELTARWRANAQLEAAAPS